MRAKDARLGVSFLAIEQRCSDPDQKDRSRDEIEEIIDFVLGTPGRTRTCDPLLRSNQSLVISSAIE